MVIAVNVLAFVEITSIGRRKEIDASTLISHLYVGYRAYAHFHLLLEEDSITLIVLPYFKQYEVVIRHLKYFLNHTHTSAWSLCFFYGWLIAILTSGTGTAVGYKEHDHVITRMFSGMDKLFHELIYTTRVKLIKFVSGMTKRSSLRRSLWIIASS
ncbi:hypothetical protein ACJX0J_016752, partial [Zea mays]